MSSTRLQLEGPDLQTLLGEVRETYGGAARIVQAEKVRRGGIAGFFAHERFHLQVEVEDADLTALVATPVVAAPPAPARSVMDLVERLNEQEEAVHGGPSASERTVGPRLSTGSDSFVQVLSGLRESVAAGPVAAKPLAAAAGRVPLHGSSAGVPQAPAERSNTTAGPDTELAIRRGVPREVFAGATGQAERQRRLFTWLESQQRTPPAVAAPGQVITVVGELTPALKVAETLAIEIGSDPAEVLVAVAGAGVGYAIPVARLLSDPADIARRRAQWRTSATSTVVVVEAPMSASPAWVASAVSALAPTFTWLVAQSWVKVADLTAWAGSVGQVDALALQNVAATGDPAAVLGGPIPVGLLDERRATTARWFDLLTSPSPVAAQHVGRRRAGRHRGGAMVVAS